MQLSDLESFVGNYLGIGSQTNTLSAQSTVGKILKQGWIFKKSKHLKSYHKRFMLLKRDQLICYKTDKFHETHESATETFDLSLHGYRVDKHDTIKLKFYLIDETLLKSRTFKTLTETERESWVFQIRNSIRTVSRNAWRHASVDNTNTSSANRIHQQRPWTFDTLESVMAIKKEQEMHDSDSEESDDDFGGYTMTNDSMNIHPTPQKRKGSNVSQRKMNYTISKESFHNFRIRSLTVDKLEINDGIYLDINDEHKGLKMMSVNEEKEEFDESDDGDYSIDSEMANMAVLHSDEDIKTDDDNDIQTVKTSVAEDVDDDGDGMRRGRLDTFVINEDESSSDCMDNDALHKQSVYVDDNVVNMNSVNALVEAIDNDTSTLNIDNTPAVDDTVVCNVRSVYDEQIIEQLQIFGYDRADIVQAMDGVVNPNNINEIKDELDANMNMTVIDAAATQYDAEMEKRARKRKYIEEEIISTEETYYDGLNILLNELIQPMFDNEYIDIKYYDEIRSSLPQILEFHTDFFSKLKAVYNERQTLSNLFNKYMLKHKEMFIDIYIEFIKDYNNILDLFGSTLHGNVELDSFLKEKRRKRMPLSGYLILPVQRVPRYILLLTDLLNSTEKTSDDYCDIADAVEMIKDITSEINERKRKIESVSQCLQIQEALDGLAEPIVNGDRMFIEQFILIKKEIKHQRLFFLFSDIVIIANEKWRVKHILDIRTLDIKECKAKKKILPEFKVVSADAGSVVYIAQDIETVYRIKKLIGKWRVKLMSGDLRQRNETLGNLREELQRQELMYD